MPDLESGQEMPNPTPKSKRNPTNCLECATLASCLLGKLPRPSLDALQPLIHKRSFQRGAVLSLEAKVASFIKIIKLGTVFGYRLGREGSMRPIGLVGRGGMFGMYGFYGLPNQTTAIAASSGRVCEIPVADLQKQTTDRQMLGEQLLSMIAQSHGFCASWSEVMRVRGVVNQLVYALLLLGEQQGNTMVELPTHTALAELLGTTRETIVRALTTLESHSAIRRVERKTYQLFEGPLLARLGSKRTLARQS